MSHYDESRDDWDNKSSDDRLQEQLADDARSEFCLYQESLKCSLLARHMVKHGKVNDNYNHTKEYWNKKTKEMQKLLRKLNKKEKGKF